MLLSPNITYFLFIKPVAVYLSIFINACIVSYSQSTNNYISFHHIIVACHDLAKTSRMPFHTLHHPSVNSQRVFSGYQIKMQIYKYMKFKNTFNILSFLTMCHANTIMMVAWEAVVRSTYEEKYWNINLFIAAVI